MKLKSVIVNLNESDILFHEIIKNIRNKRHVIEEGSLQCPVFHDGETSPHFKSSVRDKI